MNGLYIHVPFCAKKCPYCDFYSQSYRAAQAASYVDAVCRNLRAIPQDVRFDTVYFGGGTPSLLTAAQTDAMLAEVRSRLSPGAEITMEMNPRTMQTEKLMGYMAAGVNRISVGVQSFQPEVLALLGRNHSPEDAKDAILRAYQCGFENISLDLMLGLSVQDADSLDRDLSEALSLPVTHISAYLLKIEAQTPFGLHPPDMLSDDDTAARYLQLHDRLTKAGFSHYEISNFAKPGYESRHNCKYWRCEPYYAVGPAAHGCVGHVRYAVPKDLAAFCAGELQETYITDENACGREDRIMLGLRLSEGILPDDALMRRAKPLMPQYLVTENGRLRMTPEGWLVSNSVLAAML